MGTIAFQNPYILVESTHLQLMKKSFMFIAAMLLATVAFPQVPNTGPSFKNAHPGKSLGPKVPVVTNSSPTSLKGPAAKNYKVWNSESAKVQVRTRKVIDNPKGLQAKNPRYGVNSSPDVASKASFIQPKSMKMRKIWWH